MSKFTAFFAVAALLLLVSSEVAFAARPVPSSELETVQHQGVEADQSVEDGEVRCEGLNEEECLMRRTLNAHVDYIYTQKHHP